ncbi:hypothetical protein JRO89_XS03G0293600 [Xanthoceras sorbifolium]|uniref:PGG domain-containing protein n=1 Tax=Xanthoceras sorbifolium TaxID=99658 RepID=A0ABQ8ICM5_9ROSI|nr:hypothetical protein JRO89_XS03G0293600 [Xanthoceras sorbifolium]
MENLLYEAALEGSLPTLLELLQRDRLILDKIDTNSFSESPLHIAVLLGHVDFVKVILSRKPELAREVDSITRFSPLHVASLKSTSTNYVEMVKVLIRVDPDMCLARDVEGRNPLHLAAMKGRIEALVELIRARPLAAYAVTIWGESILHLCVKHNQLEALKLVVEIMDDPNSLSAKDEYGMTILHLAVADKQIETINFLLMNTRVEVNALNTNGYTALDILAQSRRDMKDLDIADSLRSAGALKAIEMQSSVPGVIGPIRTQFVPSITQLGHIKPLRWQKTTKKENWLTRKRDSLMVVASLIATMAFQAGLNPPGGLWQDNDPNTGSQANNNSTVPHLAGTSILATHDLGNYSRYLAYNTSSFIASLSIILLLITGLPFKRRFFMWILIVIVWVAITTMALTYRVSTLVFTPKEVERTVTRVIQYAVVGWCIVMGLLLLGHTIRVASNLFKKLKNLLGKKRRPSPLVYSTNPEF